MKWKELEISTTYQAFAAITNLLDEFGIGSIFKEALSQESEDEILVKAYCDEDSFSSRKFAELKKKITNLKEYDLDIGSGKLRVNELQEEDWANNWKENFKPLKVTDKIVIKPTWEDYQASADEIIIEIDPGQAFGTGQHETTTSCLEMIEKYLKPEMNCLDIGTGTGILAIAAAKLEAGATVGIDISPVAITAAQENAQLNQVADEIEFLEGDLVEVVDQDYDLVIANILPHIILDLIPDLKEVIKPDGKFILSGIVEEKLDRVKERLQEYQFKVEEVVQKNEWVTIVGSQKIVDS
ncbi:50S ribosomal protein L11 methyltransferase [Natroniella sulfidigena]|uniref:50S ribosomal protein L11 methyltransferase n=1 Tax=Natroniella sulfidigena TaxID=723921 RepID=UPI00200ACD67|nr:50S ribosomal protein L11 methyltransferase [Natroniella sulfidigena]MCK8815920.1 50S ribosomal protein L11 methyltransferase [Natroniella sulfidigena]